MAPAHGEALRPEVESAIPQYPYDPARAQQLLAQAGWIRGADGSLVHSSGERFDIDGLNVEILNVERRRINKVRISKSVSTDNAEAAEVGNRAVADRRST